MAEERLIDDDKDKNKKYTVRTNADGEEEFIIFEPAPREGVGEVADMQFDEEYAFGNRSSVRFGEEEDFVAKAKECMARGNYSTALECVARAARLSPRDGETAALELRIYTRDMTDFSHGALQGARSAVRRVAEYASKDTKERLKAACAQPVGAAVRAACDRADRLRAQNESAKEERERLFKAPFLQARKRFLLSLVPLALCTACTAVFVALFALYGGAYAVVHDYHCAVVEGAVLEEDVLYEACVDVGVDDVSAADVFLKVVLAGDDYQRAGFGAGHIAAGHDEFHDGERCLFLLIALATEYLGYLFEEVPVLARAEAREEAAYLVLENHDEGDCADVDEAVEYGAHQLQFEDMDNEKPEENECEDADEDVGSPGGFHDTVCPVE